MAESEATIGGIAKGYPKKIDPDKTYKVQLLKAVPFAGTKLKPRNDLVLTGEALSEILAGEHRDSIYGAEETNGPV